MKNNFNYPIGFKFKSVFFYEVGTLIPLFMLVCCLYDFTLKKKPYTQMKFSAMFGKTRKKGNLIF